MISSRLITLFPPRPQEGEATNTNGFPDFHDLIPIIIIPWPVQNVYQIQLVPLHHINQLVGRGSSHLDRNPGMAAAKGIQYLGKL